jgi:hypothetical protein
LFAYYDKNDKQSTKDLGQCKSKDFLQALFLFTNLHEVQLYEMIKNNIYSIIRYMQGRNHFIWSESNIKEICFQNMAYCRQMIRR